MGLERHRWPGNSTNPVSEQFSYCRKMDTMSSDSESSHAGTHSQGFSPMPGKTPTLPMQRISNISTEMLSASSVRKRAFSKGAMPGIMKRAVSSPNVRDLANLDTSAMSSAEKKRNKLGYHRTAVACMHCRRRKIRCILALDEATTRCQNCIRLKKDCQYYPVDQQPAPGKRTRSPSKADESLNESPTSETSPTAGNPSWEHSEAFHPLRYQPPTAAPERAGNYSFADPMLHSDNPALSGASYNSLSMYSQPPWSSAPVLNPSMNAIETVNFDTSHLAQWHPHAQPGSYGPEISSYPSSVTQTPLHSSTLEQFPHFSASYVGESHALPHMPYHPSRSMSLANPNDLQNYHSPYHNDASMFHQRRPAPSSVHPLASLPGNTDPTPPSSDTHSTPNTYMYGDHPQINPSYHSGTPMQSPPMAVSGSEAFGGQWYNPPVGLADVKEEEEMANMHQYHSTGARFRQHAG